MIQGDGGFPPVFYVENTKISVYVTVYGLYTSLHTQKAYTHSGTSPMQILLLLAHAYMHFALE